MEPRDRLRFQLGDTDTAAALFADAELDALLVERGGVILLAAADACDILATRFARQVDFTASEDKGFKLSQRARAFEVQATKLRERHAADLVAASGGVGIIDVERADAWTDRLDPALERCRFEPGDQLA